LVKTRLLERDALPERSCLLRCDWKAKSEKTNGNKRHPLDHDAIHNEKGTSASEFFLNLECAEITTN
jgi:hypothetical protein